jgi:DNA-binding GntR family transcriptional regulator
LAKTSQASIARRVGVSDRAVRSALKVLAGKGLVIVVQRGSLRRGPSSYRVLPLTRKP